MSIGKFFIENSETVVLLGSWVWITTCFILAYFHRDTVPLIFPLIFSCMGTAGIFVANSVFLSGDLSNYLQIIGLIIYILIPVIASIALITTSIGRYVSSDSSQIR